MGNEGYKVIKIWEPLVTGYLLTSGGDPHVNVGEFNNMIRTEFVTTKEGDRDFLDTMLEKFDVIMIRAIERGYQKEVFLNYLDCIGFGVILQ